ncbi:1-acyl-sn-glycerol-3-phosphate acyltransferase [Rhodoplanes sp. Z2-YC6860]|uniref:1-acyl-sn-glycerol-3-phosphate acyltransferase n=1 Tax=Rhodoplanes sp. Z2-YC6860 TaxID=674703 RepID=UPI00078C293E|nr:1-acyl-sn-glycerol-3-phosphate acyltransferase [Rhodoplanes sp. Z2-YC6860]AMN42494.1 phospholipid/glycerol acyltransferase [Rhodoplanes sp. Z2-YC6860]
MNRLPPDEATAPMNADTRHASPPRCAEVFTVNLRKKGLPGPLAEAVTPHVHRLLGFAQFNRVYRELPRCTPEEFSQIFLDASKVRVELAGAPLQAIPKTGPLLIVANHPLGFFDGMLIDAVLRTVRSEVSIMAHSMMTVIPDFQDRWFFVGRPGSRSRRNLTMRSLRRAMRWLADGKALLVFPAARVSRFHWRHLSVADRVWSPHVAAMALQTRATVLPVYLHGAPNWTSRFLGAFLPVLQNVRAICAVEDYRGRTLRATIGMPVQPAELSGFATGQEAIEFLRQRMEQLAHSDRS